jgi:preprotein translocase subunit SecE
MGFTVYKRGQGMYARASTLFILAFTALYGCTQLYQSDMLQGLPTLTYVAGLTLTWGMVVSAVVFLLLLTLVIGLTLGFTTQSPRLMGLATRSIAFVEFLIEVEAELRKVAWPTRKQLVNFTSVVLFAVVAFAIFIYGVDWMLQTVMRLTGIF